MKKLLTTLFPILFFLTIAQVSAQKLVLRDIIYNEKPGYNKAIVSNADANGGEFMFRTYYPPRKCNEKYQFSWTFDRDMTVLEYPDNQTVKFGINMFATLKGQSCQEDRNPFMTRSGSGQSFSRIISDTKYAGKTINGVSNVSKRVMASDYKLGGNNYRSLRDEMEIRIDYNPENDGKYVYFFFNISAKMGGQKVGSVEYEILYIYEINGEIDHASNCSTPKSSAFDIEAITSNSASLVNKTGEQSVKWRYREAGTASWTEILGYYSKVYIADLKPQSMYEIQIKKWCEAQNSYSSWSAAKSFTTKPNEKPCPAPQLHELSVTKITATSARLVVTSLRSFIKWSYRRTGSATWISLGTTSGKQRDIKNLISGTTYEFRTAVLCDNKISPFSPVKQFTTLPMTCDAPARERIGVISTSLHEVTLGVESTQDHFRWAFRKSGSKSWSLNNYSTGNQITLDDLEPGTNYIVHVKAKCGDVWSKWSSKGFVVRTKEENCSAPTTSQLAASTGPDWALISISTNQTKVDFQYRQKYGTTVQYFSSSERQKHLEDLEPKTEYEFRARVQCNDTWSAWSGWKTFHTKTENCQPVELSDLSITNITEDGATLEVRTRKPVEWRMRETGSTWKSITGFTIANGEYQRIRLQSLSTGVKYEFSVRVYCNGQWTRWSAPYPFKTTGCQIISSEKVSISIIDASKIAVEIDQPFQTVFAQLMHGTSLHDIGFISANSFVVSQLKADTDYSLFLSSNCSSYCDYTDVTQIDFHTTKSSNSRSLKEQPTSGDLHTISDVHPLDTPTEYESLVIFPNPSTDYFQMQGMSGVEQLSIVNGQGQTVYQTSQIEDGSSIDIQRLPAGSYQVIAIDKMHRRGISKLTVVK